MQIANHCLSQMNNDLELSKKIFALELDNLSVDVCIFQKWSQGFFNIILICNKNLSHQK